MHANPAHRRGPWKAGTEMLVRDLKVLLTFTMALVSVTRGEFTLSVPISKDYEMICDRQHTETDFYRNLEFVDAANGFGYYKTNQLTTRRLFKLEDLLVSPDTGVEPYAIKVGVDGSGELSLVVLGQTQTQGRTDNSNNGNTYSCNNRGYIIGFFSVVVSRPDGVSTTINATKGIFFQGSLTLPATAVVTYHKCLVRNEFEPVPIMSCGYSEQEGRSDLRGTVVMVRDETPDCKQTDMPELCYVKDKFINDVLALREANSVIDIEPINVRTKNTRAKRHAKRSVAYLFGAGVQPIQQPARSARFGAYTNDKRKREITKDAVNAFRSWSTFANKKTKDIPVTLELVRYNNRYGMRENLRDHVQTMSPVTINEIEFVTGQVSTKTTNFNRDLIYSRLEYTLLPSEYKIKSGHYLFSDGYMMYVLEKNTGEMSVCPIIRCGTCGGVERTSNCIAGSRALDVKLDSNALSLVNQCLKHPACTEKAATTIAFKGFAEAISDADVNDGKLDEIESKDAWNNGFKVATFTGVAAAMANFFVQGIRAVKSFHRC